MISTDYLFPKIMRCGNQHLMAFQTTSASTNAYKFNFFPQTIRDWNDLPDALISYAEVSNDRMSKITSFVRARG